MSLSRFAGLVLIVGYTVFTATSFGFGDATRSFTSEANMGPCTEPNGSSCTRL